MNFEFDFGVHDAGCNKNEMQRPRKLIDDLLKSNFRLSSLYVTTLQCFYEIVDDS